MAPEITAIDITAMLTDLVDALGRTLLDTLWQAALIVAGYALLRALSRGARARVFAGHLALVLLALVPILSFANHWIAGSSIEAESGAMALASRWTVDAVASLPNSRQVDWLAWLVVAWSIGVSWLSFGLLREWWALRRLCRSARPLDAAWQQRFALLRERVQVARRVGLAMSAQVTAPLLVGVVRPIVLLPASLVARLPVEQVELILMHELAHLRRLDPWFNLLQAALDTLMFYHPAVHWLSRRLRHDRELCCDDLVVSHGGDRMRYARTLLTLAEHAHAAPLSVALAASGGVLLERVERIVEVAPQPRRTRSGIWPLALLALAGLMVSPVAVQRFVSDAATTLAPLAISAWPTRAEFVASGSDFEVADVAMRSDAIQPRLDAALVAAPQIDAEPAAIAPLAPSAFDAAPLTLQLDPPAPRAQAELAIPTPAATAVAMEATSVAARAPADPLRVTMPSYPRGALRDGVEGWVRLAYGIDAQGRIEQIEVLESQPAGVFDAASIRALERWRFAATEAGLRRQHQFDFVLRAPAADAEQSAVDRCPRRTGSRLCAAFDTRDAAPDLSGD